MRRALLAISLLASACDDSVEIVQLVEEADVRASHSEFPSFRDVKEWTQLIRLEGEETAAITPPFPAGLSFDVELPENAQLVFSHAVMSPRRVARARVSFRIDLETEGQRVDLYERTLTVSDSNAWHRAKVDLAAWSHKRVQLTLTTAIPWEAPQVPWADRVLTAWGNPIIHSRDPVANNTSDSPSIVFLLVDTLRADYLGAYGFEGSISPELDRVAAEAVLFENAFANAPWTKPSVATLFTSLYPDVHGVTSMGKRTWTGDGLQSEALPEAADTLAEALHNAGYRTAAFIANPHISPRNGFSQGFEVFERREQTSRLLAAARRWLQEISNGSEPFFLYLHFMDVHGPYDPPRSDFESLLDTISRKNRRLSEAEYTRIPAYLRETSWATDEEALQLRSWRAKYAAGVRSFDRDLRPFLDELRNDGILDEAYLIVTSDHGEELMEHGGWNHGNNLYDHQIHIPLLVRKPLAESAGRRVVELVSLVDLMPTILALSKVDSPKQLQGRDLSPLLENPIITAPAPKESAVYASGVIDRPDLRGLRTGRYKVVWDGSNEEFHYFDITSDPEEQHEVDPGETSALDDLELRLRRLAEASQMRALPQVTVPIDDDVRKQLKSLGYIP